MKRLTVGLTVGILSLGMTTIAMSDIDNSGTMSGGITGNAGTWFSYQIDTGVDLGDGNSYNSFRIYANRNAMDASNGQSNEVLEINGFPDDQHFATPTGAMWGWNGAISLDPPNSTFFPFDASLKYDSFVAIGQSSTSATAPNATTYLGGITFNSDGLLLGDGSGGSAGALPTGIGFADNDAATMGNGHTLLMQITTLGDEVAFDLKVGTRAGGVATPFEGAGVIQIPAPGALALLGIAGIASRRRRRA